MKIKLSSHLLIVLVTILGIQKAIATLPAFANLLSQPTEKSKPPVLCPNPKKPCTDGTPPRSPLEINFISPSRGNLSSNENRPFLAWREVPKATYNVRIKSATETLWEAKTNQAELSYPSEQPALEPGKTYTVMVEAISENNKPIKGQISLKILDLATSQRIQSAAQLILADPQLTEDEKRLKLASFYRESGNYLLTEALNILNQSIQKGTRNPLIYQEKGDILLFIQSSQQAVETYKELQSLAITLQDPDVQAIAQIGLAKANIQLQQWDHAIDLVQTARAYYQKSNNLEFASQTAQLIGEVYENSGNIQQAINWYKQSEVEYQKLGDQARVDYVRQKISELNQLL